MALPEDAAPPGEHRALVAVTDALGSAPATELVRAISKGIGNFSEAWLRRRNARADLDIYEEWKASLVNIDELPSSFEFSIDDRAAIRLKDEMRQKQFNRERVAVEAIEDYRGSEPRDRGESGEELFDADWLNSYWQAAEQVSSRDMQSLWGRVLARQASGEYKYQLRTLDFLRTLSRSEAEEISRLAGFVIRANSGWGTGTGILNSLSRLRSDARSISDEVGIPFTDLGRRAMRGYEEVTPGRGGGLSAHVSGTGPVVPG